MIRVLVVFLIALITVLSVGVVHGEHSGDTICPEPNNPNVTFLEKPAVRYGKVTMMWEVDEPISFHNDIAMNDNGDKYGRSMACRFIESQLWRKEGGVWEELKTKNIVHKSSITRGSFKDGSIEPNKNYDYKIEITRDVEVESVRQWRTEDISKYISDSAHVFTYVPTTPTDFEVTTTEISIELSWNGDCTADYYTARWEGVGQPYTDNENSVVIEANQGGTEFCSQRYNLSEFTLAEDTFYMFMISPCPVVSFITGELACDYARDFAYDWTITK